MSETILKSRHWVSTHHNEFIIHFSVSVALVLFILTSTWINADASFSCHRRTTCLLQKKRKYSFHYQGILTLKEFIRNQQDNYWIQICCCCYPWFNCQITRPKMSQVGKTCEVCDLTLLPILKRVLVHIKPRPLKCQAG